MAALQTVIGRRVKLLLPIGLEKRISDDIDSIARILNAPGCSGHRLMPVDGEIVTEIEALQHLCGVRSRLVAAGGVGGAEGSIWLHIQGSETEIYKAKALLEAIAAEEAFTV
jgi:hypothetical protein